MIKLLIVDDEYNARYGIRHLIDWESHGIEVIGEAENGQEALDLTIQLRPHIVLTDIRMPVMDGLDFTARLKEIVPGTRVVIISGYDDFSYAMRAIRLGVNEFLLKPVDADQIIKTITVIRDSILREMEELTDKYNIDIFYSQILPQLQFNFLIRLVNSPVDADKSIMSKAKSLKINLNSPCFRAVILDIDDYYIKIENESKSKQDTIKYSIANIAGDVLGDSFSPVICYGDGRQMLVLLSGTNIYDKYIRHACEQILEFTRKYVSFTLTIGIGAEREGVEGFRLSYKDAADAVCARSMMGKNRVIFYHEVEKRNSFRVPDDREYQKEFIDSVRTLNKEYMFNSIEKMFRMFFECTHPIELLKVEIAKLLLSAEFILDELGVSISGASGGYYNPMDELEKLETAKEHKEFIMHELERFLKIVDDERSKNYKSIVGHAIQYINKNYSKDISLNNISQKLYVTPSYLSRVFKDETGENLISYINRFRIEKAKELLLEPSLKTYQVAEKVGYNDYRYFNINFKKYTGYTTKEYREFIISRD